VPIRVVRRLLGEHGVVARPRASAAQAAAGARGRAAQAASHTARRQARVVALEFGELAAYLRVRRVEQGWPLAQIQAELGAGRRWLRAQLDSLELP
jgi:hypothetical protein